MKRKSKPVRGRAYVPPPGGRHKDLRKERDKYAARGKVEYDHNHYLDPDCEFHECEGDAL